MKKSEFKSVIEGANLLKRFRNDFQFDRNSEDYLGFLNVGVDLLSEEDAETFKFIVKNQKIFKPLLEELGLTTEMGMNEEETVFVLAEDVEDLK